ncbi:hypothetical protein N184_27150 [Sinorhizobium sp. GL28]|nr:hypothetical protein N184_27150 [Sinorhizobium sp. GL28]
MSDAVITNAPALGFAANVSLRAVSSGRSTSSGCSDA